MTTYYGVLYRGGSHRCFTSTDGIEKVEVGCSHRVPRDAIDHSNALASRTTGDSDLAAVRAARSRDEDHPSSEAPDRVSSGVPAPAPFPPRGSAHPDSFGF